jgi:tyrosyl-tRNA synthetase
MPAGDTPDARSPALRALVERGFFDAASDLEAIDEALASGSVTFYAGFDPTAPSLHVGHLVPIMAIRLLQRFGHRPIVIVGGGTARVGDPTGKTEMRRLLTAETIAENAAYIRKQMGHFVTFDTGAANDATLFDNASWLLELKYVDFLREYGRHFTVNRMIAAKTYRERLEAELPLSFLEFNYQLLQAYDFLHLFRTYGCILQVGGADQWGNIIAGVELIRRVQVQDGRDAAARDVAYGLTYPLLLNADGKKMGKTERGAVWLDPDKLSAFDYYQYWISVDDRDVGKLLRMFTDVPTAEIDDLVSVSGAALREAKARLALEATALLHGRDAAENAEQASRQAFGSGEDWSAVPCVDVDATEIRLVDLVVAIGAFKSKREAKTRIEAGAVRVAGEVVLDPMESYTQGSIEEPGLRVQAGKKARYRVRLVGQG